MKTTERQHYKVVEKVRETSLVTTLTLAPKPDFVPGQYITVFFPDSGTPEGKSYSISSAPSEENFTITVKAMGEFSNRLCGLNAGDLLEASLPYGFFYSESRENDMVLIAAGIGIAPFRSMIRHSGNKKIVIHYSVKKKDEALFKKELAHVESHYYFTAEGSPRINPKQVVHTLPTLKSPEFFICGSIPFVRDMWKGLRDAGVPEDMIFTEAFF